MGSPMWSVLWGSPMWSVLRRVGIWSVLMGYPYVECPDGVALCGVSL